jgi:hypothetical protein
MGPGFLDGMGETLMGLLFVVLLITFMAGYGCSKGCDYVRANYSVKVEKKT